MKTLIRGNRDSFEKKVLNLIIQPLIQLSNLCLYQIKVNAIVMK